MQVPARLSDAGPLRQWAFPLVQIALVAWLVVVSRLVTNTPPTLAGVFDDLGLVALAASIQCATQRIPRRALRTSAALLQTLVLSLLVYSNALFFDFFQTNLSVASLRLAGIAIDARTSITNLITLGPTLSLVVAPVAAQIAVQTGLRERLRIGPRSAAALLLFAGLLLAGLSSATRRPVFLFAEHNPTMDLARDSLARVFGPLQDQETEFAGAADEVVALLNREGYEGYAFAGTAEHPLLQRPTAEVPGADPTAAPMNVVIILMESMRGLEMQGPFRDLPVTPELNAIESRGVVFPNFYANGMTTVDGEFSVLCSALPVVNEPPVYVRKPDLPIRCLPEILRERGYRTHWISAYKASYANKSRFLSTHGVDRIHDQKTLSPALAEHPQVGWGMGDVDMFAQALTKMRRFREPFFAEIMTLSNHHPFDHDYDLEFPKSFDEVQGNEHYLNYLRGMYYTDHAVGGFLEAARNQPWFDNTLFVILGDHAVRAYPESRSGGSLGAVLETEVYFRGRLILFAPEHLAPARHDVLGSQIDVAPTLLDLLEIRTENNFMGVSLLADVPAARRFALMSIGHIWNMKMGDQYCYSVGYSCFRGVFPRCAKGVEPTSKGHTCFEAPGDLLDQVELVRAGDPTRAVPGTGSGVPRTLDPLERARILDRASRIMNLNRGLIEHSRYR